MWVSGSELHYVGTDGADFAETGAAIDTPGGAIPGSIWMDSPGNVLQYIDASGVRRQVSVQGTPAAPGAVAGGLWVESTQPAGIQVNWAVGRWWNGF